jgi:hypothetical protein
MSGGANKQAQLKLQPLELPELYSRITLSEEAAAKVDGCTSVPEVLAALETGGFRLEAVRAFAHALPKREAAWWACMCARHTAPADLPKPDQEAVEAAELWVRRQTDDVRRAAMDKAQKAGFQSPEAWAAVAAFWSGDSMSPPEQPKVPPPPHASGAAVAGAVALAAVRGDPTRQPARLTVFLQSAKDIAAGGPGRLEPEKP